MTSLLINQKDFQQTNTWVFLYKSFLEWRKELNGLGRGEVLLGILDSQELPDFPNLDPISVQNIPFFHTLLRLGICTNVKYW